MTSPVSSFLPNYRVEPHACGKKISALHKSFIFQSLMARTTPGALLQKPEAISVAEQATLPSPAAITAALEHEKQLDADS